MKKFLTRYKISIMLIIINISILFLSPEIGKTAFELTYNNIIEMLLIIPPVFIILGLLDVWIKREVMIKLMGEKSDFLGIVIAFLMGSAAAGPLYVAFPIAGILLKKGSKLSNVLIFIGAWSTTKIPLLLFEASSLGWKFMLTRFIVNLFVIFIIAKIIEKVLNEDDVRMIYEKAESMSE